MIDEKKVCSTCKVEKEAFEFYKDGGHKGGLSWECKVCTLKRHKEHRKHPEVKKRMKKASRDFYLKYPERQVASTAKWRKAHPNHYWAMRCVADHRKKGFDVRIGPKVLASIRRETSRCSMCGELMKVGGGKMTMLSPTLDRIDNGSVITEDTIWIVCHRCNTTKLDRSLDEFVDYCRMIVDKFGEVGLP